MWVGHSGPTLLKLAFILICDLGLTAALILESSAIHREVQVKNNVKGGEQECPPHTSRDKMPPSLICGRPIEDRIGRPGVCRSAAWENPHAQDSAGNCFLPGPGHSALAAPVNFRQESTHRQQRELPAVEDLTSSAWAALC